MESREAIPYSDQQMINLASVGQGLGLQVKVIPEEESKISLPVISALPQSEYTEGRELFKAHQKLIIEGLNKPTSAFTVDSKFTGNLENMTEYLQKPGLKEEVEAEKLVLLMIQGGDNPRYQVWGIKQIQPPTP